MCWGQVIIDQLSAGVPCTMLCLSCPSRPVCRLVHNDSVSVWFEFKPRCGRSALEKVREGSFKPPPSQWAPTSNQAVMQLVWQCGKGQRRRSHV